MFSKQELEGYVEIDHRESPGFTPMQAALAGFPGLPVGKGSRFQSPAIKCHVCQRLVILNPDRSRGRAYCPRHDAYSCDPCEAKRVHTGECVSFQERADAFLERAANGLLPVLTPTPQLP